MTLNLSDPAELATVLGPAHGRLVVVDFDGTLAAIVDRPEDATAAPGAREALARLAGRTTTAIVSGRPVDEVRARLADPAVWIAGGHGAQLRHPDGTMQALVDTERVTGTLDEVEELVRGVVGDRPGWLVERKETSLAVHHRLAPAEDVAALLPQVEASFDAYRGAPPGFTVVPGKAVRELRPDGVDKGRALSLLAGRAPGLQPLAIGDDVTDEDAFRAATGLGGDGILVAEEDRPTAAGYRLADPAAVVRFLHVLAETR